MGELAAGDERGDGCCKPGRRWGGKESLNGGNDSPEA